MLRRTCDIGNCVGEIDPRAALAALRRRVAAASAALPEGTSTAIASTTVIATPASTRTTCTLTASASGPSTAVPIGAESAIATPAKLNTLPCMSGATVCCSSAMNGVEKTGTRKPNSNMNP
jgi:hypothetical protein